MQDLTRRWLSAFLTVIVSLLSVACQGVKGQASYRPPAIPLVISVDTDGEIHISIEQSVQLPTPLGTFSAGIVVDPAQYFRVANTLTVRLNDDDHFYNLHGMDFDLAFESGYYEQINLSKSGSNLFLELKRSRNHEPPSTPANTPAEILPTEESPEVVESGDDYTIEQIPNGKTGVEIYVSAPEGFPLDPYYGQQFWYSPAVRDIAGHWQFGDEGGCQASLSCMIRVSSQGVGWVELPPGTWFISQYFENDYIKGWWGNLVIKTSEGYDQTQGVLVTVRASWTTRITITVSKLEVGVLDENGETLILKDVWLYCQGEDVAGNPAPARECGAINEVTDSTGVAQFYIGAGTYMLESVVDLQDIQIAAGETKRLIVQRP